MDRTNLVLRRNYQAFVRDYAILQDTRGASES
jgi:hypothetical protein